MRPLSAALATLSLAVPALAAAGAATTRSDVPDQYKWKLAELYPSDEAWTRARDGFGAKIEAFAKRRGHLGDGPRAMGDVLSQLGALHNELDRIRVYAQSRNDEDMREAGPRGMRAEAESLGVKLGAASSWVRPELLALPAGKIKAALAAEPRLKDWRFYLQDVLRWKPHTLPADEERLVSMAQELAGAPATTFNVLANADLPYPTVQLSTGESIRLDSSGYEKARRMADRGDRLKVFESFFGALKHFERTDGTTLYAALQGHIFEQQVHHFGSTLEAALFRDAIPTAVYKQLVKDVNGNLPTLHRYLALRKRMMGLDQLGYEDLYVPLVKGIDCSYARRGAGHGPRGRGAARPGLPSKLRHGYESGWTDFLPSTGKRSGAYSTGVYGVHPYQLLNFNGSYETSPPWPTSRATRCTRCYPTSTALPDLRLPDLRGRGGLDAQREPALPPHARPGQGRRRAALPAGQHLEGLRTTLFRQTMFAEFELAIHERAEKGEPLTGEKLSQLYLEIVRHYYGHDQGVCQVDAAMASSGPSSRTSTTTSTSTSTPRA